MPGKKPQIRDIFYSSLKTRWAQLSRNMDEKDVVYRVTSRSTESSFMLRRRHDSGEEKRSYLPLADLKDPNGIDLICTVFNISKSHGISGVNVWVDGQGPRYVIENFEEPEGLQEIPEPQKS